MIETYVPFCGGRRGVHAWFYFMPLICKPKTNKNHIKYISRHTLWSCSGYLKKIASMWQRVQCTFCKNAVVPIAKPSTYMCPWRGARGMISCHAMPTLHTGNDSAYLICHVFTEKWPSKRDHSYACRKKLKAPLTTTLLLILPKQTHVCSWDVAHASLDPVHLFAMHGHMKQHHKTHSIY